MFFAADTRLLADHGPLSAVSAASFAAASAAASASFDGLRR
ncbi:hypothetical protein [Thermomonospora umbrina]|nr:hypothetical protein [Thermomonospora umbrina]